MTTIHAMHEPRINEVDGSFYTHCRLRCGWSGPWRRWEWLARRDGRRHVAAMDQVPAPYEPTPHVCQFCETPIRDHWWDPCTCTSPPRRQGGDIR